ncbi:hypothetical protein [Parafrankia sp. EUN1f]|uniref:hypothetical protein n=1 Tax=Parafrankia sp. EUN1f TaxID=102897 RepID=UPI0001C4524B|nr:hypothetical protein [Parafrankia sp. EUN1f]EFC79176.1 hypothetical protein FrEUN1fDRAFT_7707 [Parafrankia sp. EUN1f]
MTASITIPSRDVFADMTRQILGTHTEWDTPLHHFISLTWDGTALKPSTAVAITTDIHPRGHPRLMEIATRKELARDLPVPYAYALLHEVWAVALHPDASAAERAELDRAAQRRELDQHPDRYELAVVYCVDIHGRLWTASKQRGAEHDGVDEHFYGDPDHPHAPGGTLIRALRDCAALAKQART